MPLLGPSNAFTPSEWGAIVDYDAWRDFYSPDDGVVLHHGGGSNYWAAQTPYSPTKEAALLRSWERYHLRKGWRGLAYGWGVGQSGAIYRIRGWNRYGAHLGDVDGDGIANNDELIPIIWVASGDHHTPSPEAHESIAYLRQWFLETTPATNFYGHREVYVPGHTECPGPNGMTYVNQHRELEDEVKPPSWAVPATQWHINQGIYTEATPDDVDESAEFHRQTVFRHRFYNAIRGEFGDGPHDHDGQYVKNIIVSK